MKTDNASRENGFESVPAYLRETTLDTNIFEKLTKQLSRSDHSFSKTEEVHKWPYPIASMQSNLRCSLTLFKRPNLQNNVSVRIRGCKVSYSNEKMQE
jgi:hypothetical protein